MVVIVSAIAKSPDHEVAAEHPRPRAAGSTLELSAHPLHFKFQIETPDQAEQGIRMQA